MIRRFAPFLLLAGCWSQSPWHLDAIAAGDSAYDSSRLVYTPSASHLRLELLRVGNEVEIFLYLTQHRLNSTELSLTIEGEEFKEIAPMREGRMRVGLSKEMGKRLILALQEGKPVGILLDGFQETINPDAFLGMYGDFLKGTSPFANALRGPLQ